MQIQSFEVQLLEGCGLTEISLARVSGQAGLGSCTDPMVLVKLPGALGSD